MCLENIVRFPLLHDSFIFLKTSLCLTQISQSCILKRDRTSFRNLSQLTYNPLLFFYERLNGITDTEEESYV